MKIGIIGAMEPEVAHLIAAMTNATSQTIAGIEFIAGTLAVKTFVTRSGIGKVAASIATTLLIENMRRMPWITGSGLVVLWIRWPLAISRISS